MKKELELLNKIKNELIDKGYLAVTFNGTYMLNIPLEDWHKIFKTDEYNKLTKK